MVIIVMVLFSLAFPVLGADRVFAPGTFDPSGTWIVLSIVIGLGAAVAGGSVRRWPAGGAPLPRSPRS